MDNAISYQRNSESIQSHTLTGTTDTLTIAGIPADGGTYDTLKVWFTNETSCGDTIILKRPSPCPTDNVLPANSTCYFLDAQVGVADHGVLPDVELFNFGASQDFTIEFKVKAPVGGWTMPSAPILSDKDFSNGFNNGILFSGKASLREWRVLIADGSNRVSTTGTLIDDGNWHHIAATFDRDGNATTYQNGILIASNSIAAVGDINSGLPIHIFQDGTGSFANEWEGQIDEIRIWDKVVDQATLIDWQSKSVDNSHPDYANLIGYWPLEEGSGTTAADLSGNGNDMTLNMSNWASASFPDCPIPEYVADEFCNALLSTAIGGIVWQDFNYNGAIDDITINGIAGIEVRIYDSSGSLVTTVYTDSNGYYTATGLTAGQEYRVEFDLPQSVSCWAKPTQAGTDNGTTVQFVQAGNCANLGLADQDDYCQPNPQLAIPCYEDGSASGTPGGGDALVSIDYEFAGTKNGLVTFQELGATWGITYDKNSEYIFAASFLKRNSGFSQGEGHIHITNAGTSAYVGSFSVQGVNGIDLGTVDRSSGADYTLASGTAAVDLDAFQKIGTISFGDIDIYNETTLSVVNLNTKSLINIDISDINLLPTDGSAVPASLVTEYPFSFPDACAAGQMRPFGLKYHKGRGYLGVVCDASSSNDRNDLKAYIYDFDPLNPGTGLNKILEFDLNYTREKAGYFNTTATDGDWQPWGQQLG